MKIPHKFLLDGDEWKVRYGDPGDDDWRPSEDLGYCSAGEYKIILHPKLRKDPVELLDTLIHEMLHAIDENENDTQTPGWKLSHAVITRIAGPLARLMIENGWTFNG